MNSPSRAQVQKWMDRIEYRPGVRFKVFGDSEPGYAEIPVISIERTVPDSRNPDDAVLFTKHVYISPLIQDFAHFQAFLHHSILDMEVHEANEWFRVDGELPYDPHQPQSLNVQKLYIETDN